LSFGSQGDGRCASGTGHPIGRRNRSRCTHRSSSSAPSSSPRRRAERRSPRTESIISAATSRCCSVSEPGRQNLRWRLKMRKIRIFAHISLDGVISPGGPNGDSDYAHGGWTAPYRTPAGAALVAESYGTTFDLLLGRRTYDLWACFWPKAP